MTINKAIELADALRPSPFGDVQKAAWLISFEGRLRKEAGEQGAPLPSFPRGGDMELTATGEYEEIYPLYLCAMVDFSLREYAGYNSTVTMLNSLLDSYYKQHLRDKAPQSGSFKNY